MGELTSKQKEVIDEKLRQLSIVLNEDVGRLAKWINEGFIEISAPLNIDTPRIPTEIKKDIKHEKNPMRLKQLNKELNDSYKWYKKKEEVGYED